MMRRQRLPAKDRIPETAYNFSTNAGQDDDDALPLFTARLPYTSDANGGTAAGHRFVACGAIAHWIPVSFGVDPNNTQEVLTNITDLKIFATEDGWRKATNGGRMIHFDDSWTQYVDPVFNNTETRGNEDRLQRDVSITVSGAPRDWGCY